MTSPKSIKDMQRLTGRIAALNRFVSRAMDKCFPFFKILHGGKQFQWTKECEHAFQQLKLYLSSLPLLSKALTGDPFILYVTVSTYHSSELNALKRTWKRWTTNLLCQLYYGGRRMRYSEIEKLALALVVSGRKLRPYFQAHTIIVPTNQPQPDLSERLVKWVVELGEFDIIYRPHAAVKG